MFLFFILAGKIIFNFMSCSTFLSLLMVEGVPENWSSSPIDLNMANSGFISPKNIKILHFGTSLPMAIETPFGRLRCHQKILDSFIFGPGYLLEKLLSGSQSYLWKNYPSKRIISVCKIDRKNREALLEGRNEVPTLTQPMFFDKSVLR